MKRQSFMNDGTPILDDDAPTDAWFPKGYSRGAVQRDFSVDPDPMFKDPSSMLLVPESEYEARIKEQEEQQSSLEHVYLRAGWENLDQNGQGYCWAYSTGHCMQLLRSVRNEPYARLNPHSVAAIVKNGRDEGGWCGLSAQFLREKGIASEDEWPVHSYSMRNATPEVVAAMARRRCTEDWVDLSRQVYDQNLTLAQLDSCLFAGHPCAVDFSWWSHSVCAVRVVKIEDGSYGRLILNSWKGWGRRGLGVLRGSKAVPMGAVCLTVSTATPK